MKKLSKNGKVLIALLAVLAAGLAAAYLVGKNYFSDHFFPGTFLNGIDCSGMTAEEAKEQIQQGLLEYRLTLYERGGVSETLDGRELGIRYADDGGVDQVLRRQGKQIWFLSVGRNKSYQVTADYTWQENSLEGLLNELECFRPENLTAPADAYVAENGTSYVVMPEVQGNTLDREKTVRAVREAVDAGQRELDLEQADLYVKPKVTAADEGLQAEAALLNQMTAASVTYDFQDRQMTVDRQVIKNWIRRGEDGTFYLDEEQAVEWVKQMAYETDTFGLEHEFRTTSGRVITLAAGGDYGWVIDREATVENLLRLIREGQSAVIEPEYLYEGVDRSVNDIGNTYVEICITEQKMWCYENGVLVTETPVVTGCHSTGYDTPSGSVWAIDAKKKDAHFDTYNSDVTFWLPFNGDCGIHDASWRAPGDYGGNTWLSNGSHGCVNTPYDAAEKIFHTMEIGYPVIVYYSTEQVVGPAPTQDVEMG